jgi:glycosyltransferase involved in cell wall biosynthesis
MASAITVGTIQSEAALSARRVSVLLFDLLPTVPYYSGHLARALAQEENLELALASATYTHDRDFFQRMAVNKSPRCLDFAFRVPSRGIRRAFKLAEYLVNLAALRASFLKNKPDVIHVQFTPLMEHQLPFELWFLKSARRMGIKLVYTVHNLLPHEHSERLRASYAELYSIVDHFVCHDEVTSDRLKTEFGIDNKKVSVIPHGPLFSESTASGPRPLLLTGLEPNTRVVLWQGIIRPYKGISQLLRAWKQARQSGMNAALMIVGTGDQDTIDSINAEIRSLAIESSVRLDLRFVSVEELAGYYEAADVVVYPYTAVTTSGALMTGIGHGKAIIASDLPAFRQTLQNEKNALLIAHQDVNGWANALSLLTSNDDYRKRLAQRLTEDQGRRADWKQIANETARVYRTL